MAVGELVEQNVRSRRAWQLSALVVFGALALSMRLFHLQVVVADEKREAANQNRMRTERVAAPRGLILDREDRVLAGSRRSFAVHVTPVDLLRKEGGVELLADLLDEPTEELAARVSTGSRHQSRAVRRDVSFEHISRVAEREEDLPGVSVDAASVRTYPYGPLAAHVLGHVGEVAESEVDEDESVYKSGDFVGRAGLERVHESKLRGKAGARYKEVDVRGRLVGTFPGREPIAPRPGQTIRLHLDAPLQATAESTLVGRRGAICILDTATGGVRVLASSPRFDPNLFATGIGAVDWDKLNTDPERPLLNRTVQAQYAPGSTFKMISSALALENRLVGFQEVMEAPCVGGYQFGNRWFRCWEELGHGRLALQGALIRSCDVYYYQVAERADVNSLAEMARAGGLGVPTGIDLPQESSGNVPTSTWLDERYGRGQWTRGTMLNLIIGQGEYLATPLQMACHAATLANEGRRIVPRLVSAIEDKDGTMRKVPPIEGGRWDISSRTMSRLREGMRLVVEDEEGTGRGCRVADLVPAAKTGTSENPHGAPHSWFVGYAPFENPEVAFAVVVEAGGHGSDTALPIVRRLLIQYRDSPERQRKQPKPSVDGDAS